MNIRRSVTLGETLSKDITSIAQEKNQTQNEVICAALRLYRDYCYMGEKASVINEEILKAQQANNNLLLQQINRRTNQLLSELAIQSAITNQILAAELEVSPIDLETYRARAVEFLKINNRVFRLDEIVG